MARHQKPLPDRNQPIAVRTEFPTDGGLILSRQVVDDLARRHEFQDGYDLLTPLDEAVDWYFVLTAAGRAQRFQAERKEYLQKIKDRASLLRESLAKMDLQTRWNIQRAWRQPRSREGWHARMLDDARQLELAAQRALTRMPPHSRADSAFKRLLDQLISIYEQGKQVKATGVTKDPYSGGRYTDSLTAFVEDCCRLAGIKKTNSAIGQALSAAIQRRRPSES